MTISERWAKTRLLFKSGDKVPMALALQSQSDFNESQCGELPLVVRTLVAVGDFKSAIGGDLGEPGRLTKEMARATPMAIKRKTPDFPFVRTCHMDHDQLLDDTRATLEAVKKWARDVFCDRLAFDAGTEQSFKDRLSWAVAEVGPLAEPGSELEAEVARVQRLLDNWVRPQKAVAPGPRVRLSEETQRQIRERLKEIVRE